MADDITGQPVTPAPEPTTQTTTTQKTEGTPAPTTTAVTPPPAGTKTILEGGTEKTEKEIIRDWPKDWRERFATYATGKSEGEEYDKELKRLQRSTSPLEINKSYRQLEGKFKRGEDPDPFPSEGTDEEKTTWRKAHKVPDKPEEYIKDFSLPDGLVIGEADKPYVDEFLKAAHGENRSPDVVKSDLEFYFRMRDRQIQDLMAKDEQNKATAAETLKAEYGADFKKYLGAAYNLLETAPEGVLEAVLGARKSDGTRLGDDIQINRWLAQVALEINPAATVVPGSGAGSLVSIDTEINEIEQLMKTDREAYWSNPSKQARYRELTDAKERLQKRNAA